MKPVFTAYYSTLPPEALANHISSAYGFKNITCRLLVRGVGDTYEIGSNQGHFILRVYRSSHRDLAQIEAEIKLLLTLKRADVSVSYPIADLSGIYIQPINATEGIRYAVLFSYANGKVVSQLNENQTYPTI